MSEPLPTVGSLVVIFQYSMHSTVLAYQTVANVMCHFVKGVRDKTGNSGIVSLTLAVWKKLVSKIIEMTLRYFENNMIEQT